MCAQEQETKMFVSFVVGGIKFAVPIEVIAEIIESPGVTSVPRQPLVVDGMFYIRKNVNGLVNLQRFLELENVCTGKCNKIIIVKIGQHNVGFAVDTVEDILRVALSDIEKVPPASLSEKNSEVFLGVIKRNDTIYSIIDLVVINDLVVGQKTVLSIKGGQDEN